MAIGTLFTLLILPAVYLWLAGAHEPQTGAAAVPASRSEALQPAP